MPRARKRVLGSCGLAFRWHQANPREVVVGSVKRSLDSCGCFSRPICEGLRGWRLRCAGWLLQATTVGLPHVREVSNVNSPVRALVATLCPVCPVPERAPPADGSPVRVTETGSYAREAGEPHGRSVQAPATARHRARGTVVSPVDRSTYRPIDQRRARWKGCDTHRRRQYGSPRNGRL